MPKYYYKFKTKSLTIIDSKKVLARFNTVISDILNQLLNSEQGRNIHQLRKIQKQLINNNGELNKHIDFIINNYTYYKDGLIYKNYNSYRNKLMEQFSINEKCCILTHMELSAIDYKCQEMETLINYFLYKIIKQKLIN